MTDGVEDGRVNGQPAGDAQGTQPCEGQEKEGGPMEVGVAGAMGTSKAAAYAPPLVTVSSSTPSSAHHKRQNLNSVFDALVLGGVFF